MRDIPRSLHAEHGEAIRGEHLNRIFIPRAAAQKAARLILNDHQRVALPAAMIRRQYQVSERLDSDIVLPMEALGLRKLDTRELGIRLPDDAHRPGPGIETHDAPDWREDS
ncbi:MAG: hypothetical protein WDO56_06820 [Gammaproteobacteria bacterium]